MSLQRAQQESVLGVSHADGVVIGTDQQDPASPLLRRGQTAHAARPVTLEHVHLLVCLEE